MGAGQGVVAVAFSGGRDSTALLHATASAAGVLDLEVIALHVHHGLSEHAHAWLAHCESTCRRWARKGMPLTFAATRLDSAPQAGESIEAWARQARYRALGDMAKAAGTDIVLLGHHQLDQAETFLLQALRGGGVAALAAMPERRVHDGVTWARPWLAVSPTLIAAYARAHRLRWVDDDSNADTRFARNRLRFDVWPALAKAFPDAEAALARAARWSAQAAEVAGAVAANDLVQCEHDGALSLADWRSLPGARQSHALRAWLLARTGHSAPASLIERLVDELTVTGSGRWPAPTGELRSYRGNLRWKPGVDGRTYTLGEDGPASPQSVDLSQPGRHSFPSWGGAIDVAEVASGGLPVTLAHLATLKARSPGDRFQAGPKRPPRSLKLQFQSAAISAADRCGPVVWVGDQLVFVSGLGIDARAIARPGEPQVSLRWLEMSAAVKRPDIAR